MSLHYRHSIAIACLGILSFAATPSVIQAQDDAAGRRAAVRMDSARTALLYVSNRAADLPKGDYERQLVQKRRTDSIYAARSAGVMEFRKVTYASRADGDRKSVV